MIIPSIDLMNGQAVQLRQGRKLVLKNEQPLILAEEFSRFGPIALIDLDAALEKGSNLNLIREVCHRYETRVGGGIRTVEKALDIIEAGAEKIIIGSAAWSGKRLNIDFLEHLKNIIGQERIILALDCLREKILIKGWRETTDVNVIEVIPQASKFASEFLITCVEREGCLEGTDLDFYKKIRKLCDLPITAAGGVSTLEEISALSKLDIDVQLGMCLYTGSIKLPDAFCASLNWAKAGDRLLPTVSVDESGNVLMLAWSSPESLRLSLEKGQAGYYSRSRKKIWFKGEQSGRSQELVRVRTDCDGDTILFVVRQKGKITCHKNRPSCFGHKNFDLNELYAIIQERLKSPDSSSYTASLKDGQVREKLMEEARELVEAKYTPDIIWEAADLFYFTLVLLARENIAPADIFKELDRRNRRKVLKRRYAATMANISTKGENREDNPV
ncbi:MAG: phosphoribosyl-ATP diphosphatase [Candidatus Aminicenantes bacterium]|nr:phosphoribosyl-ATP diphosphatase [Candidatus Aminicenantes bacterium]